MVGPIDGRDAFWQAGDDTREIILAQAQKHVESLTSRLDALNTRVSGLSALLFAAAALATNVTTAADKIAILATYTASFAAVIFAVAGCVGFYGLWSAPSVFAGEPPSWWGAQGEDRLRGLDKDMANFWLADKLEVTAKSLQGSIRRRSRSLNIAILLGAFGSGLIAVTALVSAFGSHPKPSRPSHSIMRFVPVIASKNSHTPIMPAPRIALRGSAVRPILAIRIWSRV